MLSNTKTYHESRFEGWDECILRPLVYYCLHYLPAKPPTSSIVALAQRDMVLCVNYVLRYAECDHHDSTWVVLRRAFRCMLMRAAGGLARLTGTSISRLATLFCRGARSVAEAEGAGAGLPRGVQA